LTATFAHDSEFFSVSLRSERAAVYLRIDGEVDHVSEPALGGATSHLHRQAPDIVFIDLAGVSFACSTLINFFARVVNALPRTSTLVLCRPTLRTSRLIQLTAIHTVAHVRDDLPPEWSTESAAEQDGDTASLLGHAPSAAHAVVTVT
jgi:anti-anti-sigma factor